MSPLPSGTVRRTPQGADLIITRRFRSTAADVWDSITASERTALWIGPWQGEPGPGRIVRLQMAFEEGAPVSDVQIEACEPPHRLIVSSLDDHGAWHIAITLRSDGDDTELSLVQHLTDPALAADTGPGWEYYLDRIAAARLGNAMPSFGHYYPAQRAHYLTAAVAARAST